MKQTHTHTNHTHTHKKAGFIALKPFVEIYKCEPFLVRSNRESYCKSRKCLINANAESRFDYDNFPLLLQFDIVFLFLWLSFRLRRLS